MVLKYNGSILKVNHGASTIGYNGPTSAVFVFDAVSNVPVSYTITSSGVTDTFSVTYGSPVSKTVNVGDIITIAASSPSGKTFSLKGLECFAVSSATWNHKNAGSSVALTATYSGGATDNTVIGSDNYRDKSFTAHCIWKGATRSDCYDYQPGQTIDSITTVMVKDGYWKDTYTDTVADITTKSMTEQNGGGYGASGWTNYRVDPTLGYNASQVFDLSTTVSMSANYYVHNLSAGSSSFRMIIWGKSSSGSSSQMLSTNISRGYTGTYSFSSNSSRSCLLCVEMGGTSSSLAPMSHEGYVDVVGVLK